MHSSPTFAQVIGGSIVIVELSQRGDYVVAASDSRRTDYNAHTSLDDKGCKIIALGENTLFFSTGHGQFAYRKPDGVIQRWAATKAALDSYRKRKTESIGALQSDWTSRAKRAFSSLPIDALERMASQSEGMLIDGGFAGYKHGNLAILSAQLIYKAAGSENVVVVEEPLSPGQVFISGVAREVVKEFFAGKSERAIKVRSKCCTTLLGSDAITDAKWLEAAVQFGIDYAVGQDKALIHGPVDVAVMESGKRLQWIDRKTNCYSEDGKATTVATSKLR